MLVGDVLTVTVPGYITYYVCTYFLLSSKSLMIHMGEQLNVIA
jgi:hypothetical protein